MVSNLLVLNSSYVGSRDLWWVDDPGATKGYNIYRAFDYPTNWVKLNPFPWVGISTATSPLFRRSPTRFRMQIGSNGATGSVAGASAFPTSPIPTWCRDAPCWRTA